MRRFDLTRIRIYANMPSMTREQLVRKLESMVSEEGSQVAVASKLGVSPSYLSEIMRGTREPGEKFLSALNLEKHVVFKERTA